VARKSGKIRKKPEVEQSRGKKVGEKGSAPRGKCIAKGGI